MKYAKECTASNEISGFDNVEPKNNRFLQIFYLKTKSIYFSIEVRYLNENDLFPFITMKLLYKEIYDYFSEAETDSISEALTELGESEFTEEEIRLMRIKYLSEVGN